MWPCWITNGAANMRKEEETMRSSTWMVGIFLALLLQSAAALSQSDDCSALLQFAESFNISESPICLLDRSYYPKTTSWKNGTDCCSWEGVTCDHDDDVIEMDLSCSGLHGAFPSNSTLFSLRKLRRLNLNNNNFRGSEIPSRFSVFAAGMTHLDLSYSSFYGRVPPEISHLSKLVSLDLSDYSLPFDLSDYSLPFDLSDNSLILEDRTLKGLVQNLTQLRRLALKHTNMSPVSPDSFTNLSSSLNHLNLFHCSLQGVLVSSIFHLPQLNYLDLSDNYLGFNDILVDSNWTSPLMVLGMSFSLVDDVKFNSLLDKIVGLKTTLQYLDLSNRVIVGEIPNSIGKLTNLQHLDLSGNRIVGEIPQSIGKLTNLHYLGLSGTSIMGSLPRTFSNLENISYLDLSGIKNLNGTVDFEIFAKMRKMKTLVFPPHQLNVVLRDSGNVSFPELTELGLPGCNLTKFPYFLSSSKGLQYLSLSKNNITGPIPRWFWTIGNNTLETLDLSDNLITGFLQPFTWNYLTRLVLHNNMLRGALPELLLPSVQYIDASNNFLTGATPDCIWNLTSLQFLSFRFNNFQGLIPIPPLSLEYYIVSGNMFTGKIPSAICNNVNLVVLDLSNNGLVGSIPQCFENISDSRLSVLNLRKNNLTGGITSIFGTKNSLKTVNLSQNNLRGTIPRSLVNCKYLEVVDLSSNTIHDVFPSWLATLVNLQVLVLRSNMFHGPVKYYDNEVTDPFPQLRILDISVNQFSGPLPIEYMAKFKAMMDANITTEKGNLQYISTTTGYNYDDSIQVVMKGHEYKLVKILKVFTTIDLSMNSFHGEIPNIVGDLKALKGLNFSHNHITGIIPSSIGNLTSLEWLDLSSNNLTGEIPKPIAGLTFLADINLSSNRLTGEIPSGPQFNTFTSDQFEGNPGLCGFPLPKPCGSLKSPPPTYHAKDDDEHDGWINWRVAVAMGYGSGLVFGLFASYLILEITLRPKCLVLWVDRMILRFERRSKKRMGVPIAAAARSRHHGR